MNDAFKALSDPSRRKILHLLKKQDLTAGEIADHFDMTKPSISHHLNLLKQANLVDSEKKGQQVIYSLNTSVFEDVITWFMDLLNKDDEEKSIK
ncbi:autorepressor SdpR family transcription factor [Lederbergia wuyishanensis]|uniref:DNA-binding transcriptional ArsR family regulator n=1 Tax=Lederbergia wuyishanensis TaxID=1347903 RepID=A0ABU0D680_9BACI|nr:autorepressor SdpR family transcription factor [Lederbergia wuyishanensis]MCJ8008660.1 autorepressor SdpR family transcription factor [Lederbergia wuyishanensis]MDQ0343921.1 DNA-binding transcriptional ArsR family regulator [Lederbergia wuyishanensis]